LVSENVIINNCIIFNIVISLLQIIQVNNPSQSEIQKLLFLGSAALFHHKKIWVEISQRLIYNIRHHNRLISINKYPWMRTFYVDVPTYTTCNQKRGIEHVYVYTVQYRLTITRRLLPKSLWLHPSDYHGE